VSRDGIARSAILLMSIGEEEAGEVFKFQPRRCRRWARRFAEARFARTWRCAARPASGRQQTAIGTA
jgi:hypothetical protein